MERRLTDGPKGGFPRQPANWPEPSDSAPEVAWAEDKRLVRHQHDTLLEALTSFESWRLDEVAGSKGTTTYADLVTGAVLHDTYHAGQIQMLKRLARSHGFSP